MKSVILIVLDGFGIAPPGPGNPISLANLPNFKSYLQLYPNTTLKASGEAVGLPDNEAGNTEVGHLNLGAGRIVYQDLPRINLSIADGSFYKNPAFLKTIEHLKKTGGKLHLLGLVSEGSVHSSLGHLFALLHMAHENNISQIFIHAITDGRDSPPQSAIEVISRLEEKLNQLGIGKIATVCGRYYAMDRDHRWERTQKAYECMTMGSGEPAQSAPDAINEAYAKKKTDEFIPPKNITIDGNPIGLIQEGDAIIFFNYRMDRPRQLTKAFILDNFDQDANKSLSFDPYAVKYYKTHHPVESMTNQPFIRGTKVNNLLFTTMTEYEKGLAVEVAYPPVVIHESLGKILADHAVAQLRITESEKERFVTYYFSGQQELLYPLQENLIIPSPKVSTYDIAPEMSAREITDLVLNKIKEAKYGFCLVNFANPDMVGHTGNIEACIKAVQTVDVCLDTIVNYALLQNLTVLITADHGNVEQKINPKTGGISTEHTSNPVPFIAISEKLRDRNIRLQTGILADIAPTVLALLEIDKPAQMTGRNLLEKLG